ncbi:MAG: hypothetical protein GWN00_09315, partial [Aliifodinibius sp.]|nr:hypothetical protein [Fodinibius sp.]NIW44462.1 hypothetical protein [Gammaproteobacteria bacterium]NIX02230.1 hypothetical protein [Phycisphaerae bacterium]NIY24994.1 hypothetical protein [Fodinibius sp.]
DGTIRDIAVGLNNEIYIAGSFTASGSVSTRRVGVWENGSWTGFGDGLSKTARSISVADNGNLIVGGEFSMAGSVEANRVAVWDGSGWSALGDGVNGTVHAVETVGNDVFVGGEFIKSGAITSNRIAKWNGNWSALGTGVRIDYTITAGGQLTLTYLTSVGVGGTFKFLFRNNIGEESFISGNFLSHFE